MYDETIRQQSNNKRLIDMVLNQGIIAGIKVDTGAKPLAGFEKETVTEGLDGLRDRLKDYRAIGAQFAKWRAVIRITDELPSQTCVDSRMRSDVMLPFAKSRGSFQSSNQKYSWREPTLSSAATR